MKVRGANLAIICLLLADLAIAEGDTLGVASKGEANIGVTTNGVAQERQDRAVDSVANATQKLAIKKLKEQLARYAGTNQERPILSRLVELEVQEAQTLFRVIHGQTIAENKRLEIEKHRAALLDIIDTIGMYLVKFPGAKDSERMYFLRAKGHRELGEAAKATAEFNEFIEKFPKSPDVPLAHIFAAEMAMEALDYKTAIERFNQAKRTADATQVGYILEQLAEAHYNIHDIPGAMAHIEALVAHHRNHASKGKSMGMDLERALMNASLYYVTGIERKVPGYVVEAAYPYFEKLEKGPLLGKMMSTFALSLRAKAMESDLMKFKIVVVTRGARHVEALATLFTMYEAIINWKKHELLADLPKDLSAIKPQGGQFAANESFSKFRKLLVETMERMHTFLERNKSETDWKFYGPPLTAVYASFLKLVEGSDPLRPQVVYRLADHYFQLKDYERSAELYAWLAAGKEAKADAALVQDSKLRAISARYESLRIQKLIPDRLAARSMKDVVPTRLSTGFVAWIKWIDACSGCDSKAMENFEFEANRALYALGHIPPSLKRLEAFVDKRPESKFAIPSASLVLDTHVLSQDWEGAHESSTHLLAIKNWPKDPETSKFKIKLAELASDSYFKLVEAAHISKDYVKSLKMAQTYLAQYSAGKHVLKCTGLAGAAAFAQGQIPLALGYFNTIIQKDPGSELIGTAYMVRAADAEKRMDFTLAAADLIQLLSMPLKTSGLDVQKSHEIQRKVLYLSMVSDAPKDLLIAMASNKICPPAMRIECERFANIRQIMNGGTATDAKQARQFLAAAKAAPAESIVVWSTMALDAAPTLSEKDRYWLVKSIAQYWDKIEPAFRLSLVSRLSNSIPKVFQAARWQIAKDMRLPSNPDRAVKAIQQRVVAIKRIEKAAADAIGLPWVKVRALMLSDVGALYADLARDIADMKVPAELPPAERENYKAVLANLAKPFHDKGAEIHGKAFEMASSAGVEDETFKSITPPADLKIEGPLVRSYLLSKQLMAEIDGDSGWDLIGKTGTEVAPPKAEDEVAALIRVSWFSALEKKHWPRVAFMVQKAEESVTITKGVARLMKAVSFAEAGARSEGVAELETSVNELLGASQMKARLSLAMHYMGSHARDKSKKFVNDFIQTSAVRDPWFFENSSGPLALASAARWSGVELPPSLISKIKSTVEADPKLSGNPWLAILSKPAPVRMLAAQPSTEAQAVQKNEEKGAKQ